MKEYISTMKAVQGKKERKGKSMHKGELTKPRNLNIHTLIQHRYFSLFEESTDKLLDEYIQLIGT